MVIDHVRKLDEGRAWIEIDLGALAHNVAALRSHLPVGCRLMAVVKADAYGHGMERVAARLRQDGIDSFAVATVAEGVQLRKSMREGKILVLGYTAPKDAGLLKEHNLSQLVVDGAYARALCAVNHDICVHIAIDTGMHRLGIEASDLAEIEMVFGFDNLIVEGVATHLASPDSLDACDVEFTNLQAARFFSVVEALNNKGYNTGALHVQASYGIYNFPDMKCDYARAGIALYGVMSQDAGISVPTGLKPVLSLRAQVAQVRWIGSGESVSYGRTFTTDKPMKLATVSIGYADGIPRNMSGNGGKCIVHGKKAPVVGRICMDLLMIDATGIDDIKQGDVATLIGRDGGEEMRCEDVAAACGTITNEILCRMGSRLPRVYFD